MYFEILSYHNQSANFNKNIQEMLVRKSGFYSMIVEIFMCEATMKVIVEDLYNLEIKLPYNPAISFFVI